MIYQFFTDIFEYEKFPVEYECFKQLSDITDINYIAVPWTQILNSHWLDFPGKQQRDFYLKILSKQIISQQNNFTVCQHDSYMLLRDYFKHLNITKVFSPLHDRENLMHNIGVIPIAFTCNFTFNEYADKDIPVSFVGTYTSHPIRENMRNRIQGSYIIYRDTYHIDSNSFIVDNYRKKEELEYRDILERSRFSLCPRGSSPSSVRFWESLSAGAIPILISDNWVLPEWDWDNTIITIPECIFNNYTYKDIMNIVDNISIERETQLRQNCLKAYKQLGQHNYKEYIKQQLIK